MVLELNLNIFELLFFSIGLVFLFEGALYSLFPGYMKNMCLFMLNSKDDKIRVYGLIFCSIGLILLYFI